MTASRMTDPERLFSLFRDLVSIDSESGREGRIALYVKQLADGLGLDYREDDAGQATGGESGNLIITVPGKGSFTDEPMILNAHLDTVKPGTGVVVREDENGFYSESDTVLGADDKAGVAAILAVVESLSTSGREHRELEIVLTVQEESGIVGAQNLDISGLRSLWAVVVDGCGPVGGIVTRAPSQDKFKFVLEGRSAHAGVEPEKGINAIKCAADAIAELDVGRLDEETTLNIGVIKGGLAVNVVPDRVEVKGELRSLSEERFEREREKVIERFGKTALRHGCSLEKDVTRSFDSFEIDADSGPVMAVREAIEACGIAPFFTSSGAGSDANFFNQEGIVSVNINVGFASEHSKDESMGKQDLVDVAHILANIVTTDSRVAPEGRS